MAARFLVWDYIMMNDEKQFFKKLGCRIVKIRKDQNLTQTQLADMLGLSQQVIASYEAGRRHVSIWRLFAIAEVLGVAPEVLLPGSTTEKRKRGPVSKLQKQMEKISSLPAGEQKSIIKVLDMALSSG